MHESQPPSADVVTPDDFAVLYGELRRMAHAHMAGERREGHALQTTALVHEAFLRLFEGGRLPSLDRRGFFLAAAQAMRRILIEHARARGRQKRGGPRDGSPELKRINLDAVQWVSADDPEQTLLLDECVCRLEREAPDEAQVVRLRFYAGLSIAEAADVLGVSTATVERRWRFARAWLWRQLRPGDEA
jgi:RNA polymerase sigma factor (TIGR02999 family)